MMMRYLGGGIGHFNEYTPKDNSFMSEVSYGMYLSMYYTCDIADRSRSQGERGRGA
jgi:hypothetical protein